MEGRSGAGWKRYSWGEQPSEGAGATRRGQYGNRCVNPDLTGAQACGKANGPQYASIGKASGL